MLVKHAGDLYDMRLSSGHLCLSAFRNHDCGCWQVCGWLSCISALCHVLTLTVPHFAVTQMKKARVVRKVVNQLKKAAAKK